MNSGFEWQQMLIALSMIAALFLYPVIVLWLDERSKRRSAESNSDLP